MSEVAQEVETRTATEAALEASTREAVQSAVEAAVETLTRTKVQPKVEAALRATTQTRLATKTAQRRLLPWPKKDKDEEEKPEASYEGLPLVASRRQGFVTRDYYADTEDAKARSRRTPEGSGVPFGSLKVWHNPGGIELREDMGVTDVKMDLDTGSIDFDSDKYGLTDFGTRDPSPRKGMSAHKKKTMVRMKL
jgi:hypothetical protein